MGHSTVYKLSLSFCCQAYVVYGDFNNNNVCCRLAGRKLMDRFLHYNGSMIQSVIIVALGGLIGATVYFYLSERSNLLYALFGNRFSFLKKKEKKALS